MAHEMPAAGGGYLWPQITFECDGERVRISARKSDISDSEPIGFIEAFEKWVLAKDLETEIDRFVEMVVRRLEVCGNAGTELHDVWGLIQRERNDVALCGQRKLEDRLGYGPDEAPGEIIPMLEAMVAEAGRHAVEELAPAIAGDNPRDALDRVKDFARSAGVSASLDRMPQLPDTAAANDVMPWTRGHKLAQAARSAWKLGPGAVQDDQICNILKIPPTTFTIDGGQPARVPVGLAIRAEQPTDLRILLRKRHPTSRRFEVIRLLSDHLMAPKSDRWLLATDAKTARQQSQRAFAAEFLCPIDGLKQFLSDNYTESAREDAAQHFRVSEYVVAHQLENHLGFAPNLMR